MGVDRYGTVGGSLEGYFGGFCETRRGVSTGRRVVSLDRMDGQGGRLGRQVPMG